MNDLGNNNYRYDVIIDNPKVAMYGILAVVVENDVPFDKRETIKERQAEGIAVAKAEGRYKGRIKKPIDQNEFISLYNRWQDGEIQKKFICKKLNVSMATLDRRIAEYRKNSK